MKRLGVVVISLCVVLVVLCSAAVARGRALVGKPDELQVLGLNLCNGIPCFFGLTPGRAAWSETKKSLISQPNAEITAPCVKIRIGSDLRKEALVCTSQFDETIVGSIKIEHSQLHSIDLSIATIIQHFGAPCFVVVENGMNKLTSSSKRLFLNYPQMEVNVIAIGGRLGAETQVFEVLLYSDDPDPVRNGCRLPDRSDLVSGYTATLWQGLTRLEHYLGVP
jgi:hypothetical protein